MLARLTVLWISLYISMFCFAQQTAGVIYVAVNGNDSNPGSKSQPLATLAAARKIAAGKKKASGKPQTICFTAGTYTLEEPVILGSSDNGLRIIAADNEKVVLSNAVNLQNKKWKPVSAAAHSRLHPAMKTKLAALYEYDISDLPFSRLKRFAEQDSFMDIWPSIDLFANEKRQPIAQWPNAGEVLRKGYDAGWATCNGAKDAATFYFATGGNPDDKDTTNEPELDHSNRIARWQHALDNGYEIWLKGFWRVPWGPITSRVKAIERNAIRLAEAPDRGMGSKYSAIVSDDPLWRTGSGKEKWMLLNALEEIDQPGEWALDTKDKKIYYYSPVASAPAGISIAVRTTPVLEAIDASGITIEGITLNGSLAQAIRFKNCSNTTIAGCNISNVGDAGISINGGTGNRILSNTIFETGAAAIIMQHQGHRQKLLPSASSIDNNYIHHIGEMAFNEAIQLAASVGVTVSHNLMHDLPKSAIRTDLINNCLFQFNEIHNIALKESDNGAFYNYGGWTTYGNIFRYNFLHHLHRSNGLYCDDGDSGDMFYNNIIHDAIEAIKFGGGHDNMATNNLIINSKSQVVDDRGRFRNYTVQSEYGQRVRDIKPDQEPWKSYGLSLAKQYQLQHTLWSDILKESWHPEYPNGCRMSDNITVNSGKFEKPEKGEVEIRGNAELKSVKEAMFEDYEGMVLKTKHPLILQKLPRINTFFDSIGLYTNKYRKSLPSRRETGGLVNRTNAGDPDNEDQFIESKQ